MHFSKCPIIILWGGQENASAPLAQAKKIQIWFRASYIFMHFWPSCPAELVFFPTLQHLMIILKKCQIGKRHSPTKWAVTFMRLGTHHCLTKEDVFCGAYQALFPIIYLDWPNWLHKWIPGRPRAFARFARKKSLEFSQAVLT